MNYAPSTSTDISILNVTREENTVARPGFELRALASRVTSELMSQWSTFDITPLLS